MCCTCCVHEVMAGDPVLGCRTHAVAVEMPVPAPPTCRVKSAWFFECQVLFGGQHQVHACKNHLHVSSRLSQPNCPKEGLPAGHFSCCFLAAGRVVHSGQA